MARTMTSNTHIGVRHAGDALPGPAAPHRNTLPVDRGQQAAVHGPLHEGLRPEGAPVHVLRLRPSRVIPQHLCATKTWFVNCR